MIETDLRLDSGRILHVYDTGADAGHPLTVFWHHGTPNVGAPPQPLLPVSERLGIRWVSHDRPGYGGSTPVPGRTVASAADDVAAVADSLGIEQFAVMGHSGGSAHALACGVLLPDRVVAVVAVSGLAPYSAEGLDWFAGMAEGGVAGLSAAAQGRKAKERYEDGIRRSTAMATAQTSAPNTAMTTASAMAASTSARTSPSPDAGLRLGGRRRTAP